MLNSPNPNKPNVLMDGPGKHPGITHFALLCPDIMAAKERSPLQPLTSRLG
jgi:hypothetical protein